MNAMVPLVTGGFFGLLLASGWAGLVFLHLFGGSRFRLLPPLERIVVGFVATHGIAFPFMLLLVALHLPQAWGRCLAPVAFVVGTLLALRRENRELFRFQVQGAMSRFGFPSPAALLRSPLTRDLAWVLAIAGIVLAVQQLFFWDRRVAVAWGGDELFSWLRWAKEWSDVTWPTDTRYYPQASPAIWGLQYLLQGGAEVPFFVKAQVSVFHVMALLLWVSAFRRVVGGSRVWILAAACVYFFLLARVWSGGVLFLAQADIPVVFMILVAFHFMILALRRDVAGPTEDGSEGALVWVALGAASVAALVKQSGLPALAFVSVVLLTRPGSRRTLLRSKGLLFLLLLAPISWYGGKWISQVLFQANHLDRAESWLVSGGKVFYSEQGFIARVASALRNTWLSWPTPPLGILLTAALVATLFSRIGRLFTLFWVLPFLLLWAGLLAYDQRNLLPLVPGLALALAFSFSRFRGSPSDSTSDRKAEGGGRLALIAAGASLVLLTCVLLSGGRGRLEQRSWESLDRNVGDSRELNASLLSVFPRTPSEPVYTCYPFLTKMPRLRSAAIMGDFGNLDEMERDLRRTGARYLVYGRILHWSHGVSPEVRRRLDRAVREGRITVLYDGPQGWVARLTTAGALD